MKTLKNMNPDQLASLISDVAGEVCDVFSENDISPELAVYILGELLKAAAQFLGAEL